MAGSVLQLSRADSAPRALATGLAALALLGGGPGGRAAAADGQAASAAPGTAAVAFPQGFLTVKLEDTADQVRKEIPKSSQAFELPDLQDCPTAPKQPCLRIVEKVPNGYGNAHSRVDYWFSPFNGRLARITVEYRIDYLDIEKQFVKSFGEPTTSEEKPLDKSAFLGAGHEITKTWRKNQVEVVLVYTVLAKSPNEANAGHVEFRSVAQLDLVRELSAKMKELAPATTDAGTPATGTQPAASDGGKKDEAPPKLF